jgi:hypothetical protein
MTMSTIPRGSANSGASNSQYRQPFHQPTHTARKFLRRSSHVLHWKEDIARRNFALIILLILLILWIFGEPIFFPMPFHIHKVLDFGTTEP